jgi:hypothetical protein
MSCQDRRTGSWNTQLYTRGCRYAWIQWIVFERRPQKKPLPLLCTRGFRWSDGSELQGKLFYLCLVYANTQFLCFSYTGRFIKFSVITNIYSKKTKGHTLMNCSQPQENWNVFLQLEVFDVCTTGDTHGYSSMLQWRISMHPCWRVRGRNLNIVSMCAV